MGKATALQPFERQTAVRAASRGIPDDAHPFDVDYQQRYAMASSAGRVVVWNYDIPNDRVRTEPPLADLLGFAPGTFEDGDGWEKFLHPDDREWVRRSGSQGFKSDAPRDADGNTPLPETEYRAIGRHGAIYWLADRGTVVRRPNGEPYGAVGAITDITERKRVEEELRRVTGEILRVQDEERRRIARDLHDGAAQDIAAIAINLMRIDHLSPELTEDARAVLTATQELAETTLRGLRTLSYLLHPPLLEQGGLAAAIREYVEGFARRTGITVDLAAVEAIGELPYEAASALYRVVQECLVNVQRHSGSGSAAIRLAADPDGIVLQVRDSGRGMGPRGTGGQGGDPGHIGVGIASMRERMRHIGGGLEIRSGPSGTTVSARLPGRPKLEKRNAR